MTDLVHPRVSGAWCTVIVPARDAADTIAETLASVRAQTLPRWEAVVVDDGSADATAEIVRAIAAQDGRIRLIEGMARGVGAARNVGIRSATSPLICFLDADDLLAATFLERMVPPLDARAGVVATYTGWLRLAPDGSTEEGPCPTVDGDLFAWFAAACIFPPHACVIRRDAVADIGGFDERPTTTEDWDLWQRVARTGASFVRVPGALVTYRMRLGSRSRDARRVLDDGLAVIACGHAPDPRVDRPHPAHARGLHTRSLARHSYNHLSWAAGMALASGEEPSTLLQALTGVTAHDLEQWEVGGTMLEAMRVTRCAPQAQVVSIVAPRADKLLGFLNDLERVSGTPDLALRAGRAIDYLIAQQAAPVRPRTLVTSHDVVIDLEQPLVDVEGLPPRIDRFRAELTYAGERMGDVELPVCDGRVSSVALADAAAEAAAWRLLHRFLGGTVFPTLALEQAADGFIARRNGVVVGRGRELHSGDASLMFEAVGWTILVQELFGMPGSSLSVIYDAAVPTTDAPVPVAGRIVDCEVSDALRDLRVEIESVLVRCTVAGALLGLVSVPAANGLVAAGTLRRVLTDTSPDELVHLVTRESIIGWPLHDGVSLQARLARRRMDALTPERRALAHGGVALLRHRGAPVGGPAARHVPLPIAARATIERLAHATGTPTVVVPPPAATPSVPPGAAYVPEINDGVVGAALEPMRAARRPAIGDKNESDGDADDGVLVLAYEHIAADSLPTSMRGTVHCRDFEEQVAQLRERGYRGLNTAEWQALVDSGQPCRGRRALFTFDGGYAGFAEHAWPILQRHGFGALVFLVTGAVNGTARRADRSETPVPLMNWETIRSLHAQGVVFGSNSVTHPWLTGRPVNSVVAELFNSRSEIESALGDRVTCFAYPYGAEDRAVQKLAGAAGYRLAMSRRRARWTPHDHPLAVPRHVVRGHIPLDDFARLCAEP